MQDITFMYLLRIAWKRLWALVLGFIICAFGAFSYCKLVAVPMYRASATILVTNGAIVSQYNDGSNDETKYVSGTDISASRSLLSTVVGLLNSSDMYKRMAQKLGGSYTYSQLKGMGSAASNEDQTLFVTVSFRSKSGTEAQTLANKFAEISCDYIPELIPYSKVKVTESALSYSKIYPRTLTTTAMAGIVGILVAFGIAFLVDFSNQAVRGEEEFVEKYDVPLLGSVPDFENVSQMGKVTARFGRYKYAKGGYYGAGK